MLEVLRGHEVSDVVAVVTRYFGGVLLGAGGLVRAYGDAVRAGLEAGGTLRRELLREQLLAARPCRRRAAGERPARRAGSPVLDIDVRAHASRCCLGVPAGRGGAAAGHAGGADRRRDARWSRRGNAGWMAG